MSKLVYKDISNGNPKVSRGVKTDDDAFHEELRLRAKANKRGPTVIYRSGQAPAGFDEDEDEREDVDLLSRRRRQDSKALAAAQRKAAQPSLKAVMKKRDKGPRRIATAEIVEAVEEVKIDVSQLEVQGDVSSSEEEEEDELTSRRARARIKMKQKQEEEKKKEVVQEAEAHEAAAEEEEEGSSEYETDTSDDEEEYTSRPLLKPVFVSKKDRETVAERDRKEQEEEEARKVLEKRAKERKLQSRQLVIDEVKREEELAATGRTGHELEGVEVLPDDNDDINEEEEIEQWKIRELKRVKRDKEEAAQVDAEAEEVEKRRKMTDAEIEEENRKNPKKMKEKGAMRYLQKYYHPGGFFQDDDEDGIRLRDFAQATGEDSHVDRTLLPSVLQVKKNGHKSRTKWTHLMDQDTSGIASKFKEGGHNPWAESARDPKAAAANNKHKMGGVGGSFARPSKRSRTD